MNYLRIIINKFSEWLQSEYEYIYVNEFPQKINVNKIYIVGESEMPWVLAFMCPCGCNNLIQLNLLQDAEPRWKFRIDKQKKIYISPSVWRIKGCQSHFFIRKSKIHWIK